MRCPSCQYDIDDGSAVCGVCGATVAPPPAAGQTDLRALSQRIRAPKLNERGEIVPSEPISGDDDHQDLKDAAPSYLGQIIDRRYQVLSLIARGGMGAVYKVVHIHMRKILAMKLLHEHMLARRSLVARFMREARAVSRLSNRHTVRVYDFGKHREVFYLVMEFLDGEDLYALLQREGPIGVTRTVAVLDQICSALEEAHAAGIIHRDLKSENIMVVQDTDGREFIKVLDFGLAKVVDPDEPISSRSDRDLFGTPFYMSPEQIRGRPVDPRADIYALGVLGFRMLGGTFPFAEGSAFETLRAHLVDPIPSLRKRAPNLGVPGWLDRVIRRCLAKEPDARYADVRAFREALRAGLSGKALPLDASEDADGHLPTLRTTPQVTDLDGRPEEGRRDPSDGFRPYDPDTSVHELQSFQRGQIVRRFMGWVVLLASLGIGAVLAWQFWGGWSHPRGAEHEPNNTRHLATEVDIGWAVSGHVGKRLSRTESDVDWYRVLLPDSNPRLLDLRLEGVPNMNLQVEVRDPGGRLVALIDREGLGEGEVMTRIPVASPHVLIAVREAPRGPGALPTENLSDAYRLWTRVNDRSRVDGEETEPNDTPERSQALRFGQPTAGELDSPGDVDHYHVILPDRPPQVLSIRLSGHRGVPVRVQLLDPDGRAHFRHTFPGRDDAEQVWVARAWPFSVRLGVVVSGAEGLRATGSYRVEVGGADEAMLGEREPNNDPVRAGDLVFYARTRGALGEGDAVDIFRVRTSANPAETTEITFHARSQRRPRVTVRLAPRRGPEGAGSALRQAPLKIELGREPGDGWRWRGNILLGHAGAELLLTIEPGQRGEKVDYAVDLLRSPSFGVSTLDPGD